MTAPVPDLSIVICTLNRYADLDRALAALSPQRQSTRRAYEVLVVDQTEAATRDADLAVRYPFVTHHGVDEQGLSKARNLGINRSRGALVAFLDDDAVACESWVETICEALAPDSAPYLACGGSVSADYGKGRRPVWMTPDLEHYLSCVDWSPARRTLAPHEWIVGANIAFRREVFDAFGLFDVSLGRSGAGTLLSNEEIKLIKRIGHARILYEPAAHVRHIIPVERMQQAWFRKRAHWQAISDVMAGLDVMSADVAWEAIARFDATGSVTALYSDAEPERFPQQVRAVYALGLIAAKGWSAR